MTDASARGIRDKAKNFIRTEIANIAIEMFLDRGFEEVTTDDIVAAAGVSRRTFFRYIPTKEDAVLGVFTDLALAGCERFVARPPSQDMWDALQHSLGVFMSWVDTDPRRAWAILSLIKQTPTLQARFLDRLDQWATSLRVVVAQRVELDPAALYPAVIAKTTMSVFDAALERWVAIGPACDLNDVVDEAFRAIAPQSASPPKG
jgi:AcrR family transcriptional regulator